ncbi:MAG: amino acid ABC transporter permease [Eubacteriaceae bacterium]|nr:amino acid ABC transporter permease [Eubacteriaceae bacterium]
MKALNLFTQHLPTFLKALAITTYVTVISLIFATLIGIVFGLFKISKKKPLVLAANFYLSIIRGTPLLVQTLFIYFGLPMALGFRWPWATFYWRSQPILAAIVIMSLNAGAYMTELVRGGIESVDPGQMEAARSLGMSYGQAMVQVVMPQALRTMLPSIVNQFIVTLKDTSLLSMIGLRELVQNAKIIVANNMEALTMYAIVGLFYWVIVTLLSSAASNLERRTTYGK